MLEDIKDLKGMASFESCETEFRASGSEVWRHQHCG